MTVILRCFDPILTYHWWNFDPMSDNLVCKTCKVKLPAVDARLGNWTYEDQVSYKVVVVRVT